MNFNNWLEKIKSNRDNFIEYYVHQFVEENRNLITERFDSLKFCFYVNPNDIQYWYVMKLTEEYTIAAYQFLKTYASKFDIDASSLSISFSEDFEDIEIHANDKNTEKKIHSIFKTGEIGICGITEDDNFFDLYSFRSLEDFINGCGKEYGNPKEELLKKQLLFLKDMGDITIKEAPIDYFGTEECKKFVNSSKFKELYNKYHFLAEEALVYKKEVDNKYKDLINYMKKSLAFEKQIIKKYDTLKQGIDDTKKLKEYEKQCKKEIAFSRIVCSNFDISSYLDKENIVEKIVDSVDTQFTITSSDENYLDSIILFCPFRSIPGYEDVDLRHEIRHAITSSAITDGNTTIYKIGNKIEKYEGEECVESHLSNYNEWVTQTEAKKETQDAFSKGIYIISKPSLKNHNFIGKTSDYDNYLSLFEIIYSTLPMSAKQSQLESSNDSLYNFVSLEQLSYIEEMILKGDISDDKLIDQLNKISEQLKKQNAINKTAKK